MTFKSKPEERKFGTRETRVVSIRVPVEEYESIKTAIYEFVNSHGEDNVKRIRIVEDGIKEIISERLDIIDYIKKERSITDSKYLEILDNHNIDLINDVIAEFPIERKIPIKTLTEEKREEERRKRKREEGNLPVEKPISYIHVTPNSKELRRQEKEKRKQGKKLRKSFR
ncbi:hypothetical protein LCGC14_0540390 [marine sediment metagenome]|uniref:Uncharacterized protein n=1 Tax=marine sediment metagenome TaxID=412755 RepID=A0A0F9SBI1_9ZZZZ